jgi:hypothetical protein
MNGSYIVLHRKNHPAGVESYHKVMGRFPSYEEAYLAVLQERNDLTKKSTFDHSGYVNEYYFRVNGDDGYYSWTIHGPVKN